MSKHKCNCGYCEYEPDPFEGMTVEEITEVIDELLDKMNKFLPLSGKEQMEAASKLASLLRHP